MPLSASRPWVILALKEAPLSEHRFKRELKTRTSVLWGEQAAKHHCNHARISTQSHVSVAIKAFSRLFAQEGKQERPSQQSHSINDSGFQVAAFSSEHRCKAEE